MSQISSKDIKKLRVSTGAGFMDCKKALEETKSDFDLAIDWLRKNGISSAKKKISRIAQDLSALIESLKGYLLSAEDNKQQ